MPRARDLGIPLEGLPGTFNAITDVAGVEVGHTTLMYGAGKLIVGEGPVRTGVTAILPCGKQFQPVFAAGYNLNGNGELTGMHWVEESGFLESPILITNTHSVGVVRDATIGWLNRHNLNHPLVSDIFWHMPVVGETYDGILNDINGFHVRSEHVVAALDSAASGMVAEGAVGGGTGMICHGFKGGIGTASRQIAIAGATYQLGALVQANHGNRQNLTIAGVSIGRELQGYQAQYHSIQRQETGSIIVVLATDAPLLPHQLKRLCRRIPLGIGRVGAYGGNGSGDIFLAFSTAQRRAFSRTGVTQLDMLANDELDPIFEAVVQAVEEAILNALISASDMVGRDGNTVYALPHEAVQRLLQKYQRMSE
jgi:D-aminopeptidase